jgi:hypothetical protein
VDVSLAAGSGGRGGSVGIGVCAPASVAIRMAATAVAKKTRFLKLRPFLIVFPLRVLEIVSRRFRGR